MAASAGGSVRELTSCRRNAGHSNWAGHTAGSCPALTRRGRAGGARPGWWSCVWAVTRGQCSAPSTASGSPAAEPGAQASGQCGVGCRDPRAGLVVRAAPDDLRIPRPRRRACWRWACGPRWCLRSPLMLPRVLHEPASAWGSHRGSGGHRPGWGLPRAVKHPHCGPTGQGRRGWKLPVSASQWQSTWPGGSSEPSPRVGGRAGRAQDHRGWRPPRPRGEPRPSRQPAGPRPQSSACGPLPRPAPGPGLAPRAPGPCPSRGHFLALTGLTLPAQSKTRAPAPSPQLCPGVRAPAPKPRGPGPQPDCSSPPLWGASAARDVRQCTRPLPRVVL